MSINRVIKLMNDIRAFAEDGGLKDEDLRELTGEYGEAIRQRLIDGVEGGYDIEGKQFRKLQPSTISIRRARGISHNDFLRDRHGGIRGFLEGNDLFSSGKVQITLNKPYGEYMIHQNEGFTPTKIPVINNKNKVVYIDNEEKKISVPARKWYGIPKTYREGGTKYNEFLKKFVKRIEENFARSIKRS
tara:strand:+ start:7333 stop:7896 length:564 start_codon:yes stop_codon:yes gene_type:complete